MKINSSRFLSLYWIVFTAAQEYAPQGDEQLTFESDVTYFETVEIENRTVGELQIWGRNSKSSIQIQLQLLSLSNVDAFLASGRHCDVFHGPCDPACYYHWDLGKKEGAWKFMPFPGQLGPFKEFFYASGQNSPVINKTFVENVCTSSYKGVRLEIFCEDRDAVTPPDVINRWSCPVSTEPTKNELSSQWSSDRDCIPGFQRDKIKLSYRYKIYFKPDDNCQNSEPSTAQIRINFDQD